MPNTNRSTTKEDIEIGKRIKQARLAAGLTQAELGAALTVTFQQIQKYEKGTNRVSGRDIARMSEALGKPAEYFLGQLNIKLSAHERKRTAFLATPQADAVIRQMMRLTEKTQNVVISVARSLSQVEA
jgi:transcriptional regulator with XRE-family HTH domain